VVAEETAERLRRRQQWRQLQLHMEAEAGAVHPGGARDPRVIGVAAPRTSLAFPSG
jgi:hypothetical protein